MCIAVACVALVFAAPADRRVHCHCYCHADAAGMAAAGAGASAAPVPVGGLSVQVVGERNPRGIPSMVFIVRPADAAASVAAAGSAGRFVFCVRCACGRGLDEQWRVTQSHCSGVWLMGGLHGCLFCDGRGLCGVC